MASTGSSISGIPLTLPLVFTHERSLYTTDIQCIFDNDSFTEILNEDFDSYVLNPWSWNKNTGFDIGKLPVVVIAIATLITNILVIVTFVREKLMSAINIILIGISLSDTLTVCVPAVAIVYMYADGIMPDFIPFEYCKAWGYLTKYLPTITHNASVWLTVVLAYDRFLAIRHPFLLRRLCLPKKSISVIIGIYAMATFCHLCRFFDTDYIPVKIVSAQIQNEAMSPNEDYISNVTASLHGINISYETKEANKAFLREICDSSRGVETCRAVYKPVFGEFQHYEFCYYWFVILFVKFIPCITMIILDSLMLKSLYHAEEIRQTICVEHLNSNNSASGSGRNRFYDSRRMTIITIIAIIIVVLVEIPIGVILIFWTLSEIHGQEFLTEKTLNVLSRLANMTVYISYPLIFLLYCCISTKFRRAFCRICCHCSIKRCNCLENTH